MQAAARCVPPRAPRRLRAPALGDDGHLQRLELRVHRHQGGEPNSRAPRGRERGLRQPGAPGPPRPCRRRGRRLRRGARAHLCGASAARLAPALPRGRLRGARAVVGGPRVHAPALARGRDRGAGPLVPQPARCSGRHPCPGHRLHLRCADRLRHRRAGVLWLPRRQRAAARVGRAPPGAHGEPSRPAPGTDLCPRQPPRRPGGRRPAQRTPGRHDGRRGDRRPCTRAARARRLRLPRARQDGAAGRDHGGPRQGRSSERRLHVPRLPQPRLGHGPGPGRRAQGGPHGRAARPARLSRPRRPVGHGRPRGPRAADAGDGLLPQPRFLRQRQLPTGGARRFPPGQAPCGRRGDGGGARRRVHGGGGAPRRVRTLRRRGGGGARATALWRRPGHRALVPGARLREGECAPGLRAALAPRSPGARTASHGEGRCDVIAQAGPPPTLVVRAPHGCVPRRGGPRSRAAGALSPVPHPDGTWPGYARRQGAFGGHGIGGRLLPLLLGRRLAGRVASLLPARARRGLRAGAAGLAPGRARRATH
mmetsp:Transcript_10844/g.36821  ORF Transcript_10844/g.36821 Transcript_10844/m.36821 type:complete len:537 (+) Transcript_10844:3028-4638(+)